MRDVVYLHPEQVANLYYDRDAIKPRYFEMVFDVDTVNQVIDEIDQFIEKEKAEGRIYEQAIA